MRELARHFKKFWLNADSTVPLAHLRIGVSAVLLCQALILIPWLFDLYGENGIIQLGLNRYFIYRPYLPQPDWILSALSSYMPYDNALQGLFLIYLGSCTALLLGWHTTTAASLTWLLHYLFLNSNTLSNYGVDRFFHLMLFYFLWVPVSHSLSLDALRSPRKVPSPRASVGLRLIQLHLCVVYFDAGVSKALGAMWWNGEAIWRAFMLPEYRQFNFSWLVYYPWIPKLLGWMTVAIETSYPVLIWPKATRHWMILATAGLHVGIVVLQGLQLFGLIMLVLTAAAFGGSSLRIVWRRAPQIVVSGF